MHRVRSMLVLALASTLVALGLVAASPSRSAGDPGQGGPPACSAFDDPIYRVVKPNNLSLLTPWRSEAESAVANHGFADDGEVFRASVTPAPGLVEVHRLYRPWPRQDFVDTASEEEWRNADSKLLGYRDHGRRYYASPVAADCLSPVYVYAKGTKHRLSGSQRDRAALVADDWKVQGVAFYAAVSDPVAAPAPAPAPVPEPSPTPTEESEPTPSEKPAPSEEPKPTPSEEPEPTPTEKPTPTTAPAPAPPAQPRPAPEGTDTEFTFAAYPDTQRECWRRSDTRFLDRTKWLVQNKSSLDLRFATHSGDVVDWDTPKHDQYEHASEALRPLESAGIPYTLAIGNHDTGAVGPGGSAKPGGRAHIDVRDTSTFNAYFNASRYTNVRGAYESGKVDNIYATYEAGGVKWMVLILELWPRQGPIDWAKKVVADHPNHNVIVVTHEFLDGGNGIGQSNGGYGANSPQHLYNQLIGQYANIRIVLSGHVGIAGARVDTGKHGNKIYSFLNTFHSESTNPVRLFTVDTEADTIKTWVYAPHTNQTFSEYSKTLTGVDFVE
jgi:hypothetical protein